MKLLVIGGTGFIGRHLTEAAAARQHSVTVFSRGTTERPAPRAGVTYVGGDREGGLDAVLGTTWDAVVDVYGHLPRVVGANATALAPYAGHYVFISTTAVYAAAETPPSEIAPLRSISDEAAAGFTRDDDITGEAYGPLKVRCEAAVESAFPDRSLIVRPALINGAYDSSLRLPYWVVRLKLGGEILAPGDPARRVQSLDVRDLADWLVSLVEQEATGVYNAGEPDPPTFASLLARCAEAIGADPRLTWVSDEFLEDQTFVPDGGLPSLWFRTDDPDWQPVDVSRALAAGLRCRPFAETVDATLAWIRRERPRTQTLPQDVERRLLADWHRGRPQAT